MENTQLVEGEIIEGTVAGNRRRDLILDVYFTFADFLVTRLGPSKEKVDTNIRIAFFDNQSDLIDPPRDTVIRAVIDTRIFGDPALRDRAPVMLTDIAFIDRRSGEVIRRIPTPPMFPN